METTMTMPTPRSRRLALAFAAAGVALPSLALAQRTDTFDASRRHQTIDFFGAHDAWTAQVVGRWDTASRDRAAELLFSKTSGIGLSGWHFNFGAGIDTTIPDRNRTAETFEVSQGVYDWTRQAGERWFLRSAKSHGVESFHAVVYSPPKRMTKNGRVYPDANSGTTNLRTGYDGQFAAYMADILQHFRDNPDAAERIAFDTIAPINEPQWSWEGGSQEGNRYSISDIKRVTRALHQQLAARSLGTDVSLIESGQIQDMYGGRNYLSNLAGDPTFKPLLDGTISYHSYWSDGASLLTARQSMANAMAAHPDLRVWQTEYCILGADGPGRDLGMTTALRTARTMHFDLTVANVSAWSWWLAMSPYDYKDGLVYYNPTSRTLQESKTLWAVGHYSRFLRPGFQRIDFGGANTDTNGVLASGWRNPGSGELVFVYSNPLTDPQSIRLDPTQTADYRADYVTPYLTTDAAGDNLRALPPHLLEHAFDLPARSMLTFVSGTLAEDNTGKLFTSFAGSRDYLLGGGLLGIAPLQDTYAGAMSGAGGVLKTGGGTLTFTGNNTYAGDTVVRGGTLVLAGTANAPVGRLRNGRLVVESGATAVVGYHNALGGNVIANIPPVLLRYGGRLTTADTMSVNLGPLTLAGGDLASGAPNVTWGSWTLNRDLAVTGGVTSTISARQVQVRGTVGIHIDPGSALRVTGSLRNITGGTGHLVQRGGGTLQLTDTVLASVSVEQGTLHAHGNVQADLAIGVGGTLGAGQAGGDDRVGSLALAGNLTLQPASQLLVDLASASSFDQIVVTGAATLGGSIRPVLLGGFVPAPGDAFTVLDAATLAGSFNAHALGFARTSNGVGGFRIELASGGRVVLRDFLRVGDVDGSGAVNNQDIAVFVSLLTGAAATDAAQFAADVDGNGLVNNQDIAPFVALLTAGRPIGELAGDPDLAPLVAMVPEPAVLSLAVLGVGTLLRRRRGSPTIR
jgi:autotransporter-associated beta strand protein